MAEESVQFGESEKLPVTFSAGIAAFPEQADNVTELLSSATLTLGEARSSGGDAIRVADRTADERADARGFDVLHGLVIAVDNKDRYTKRHSEDVARYAASSRAVSAWTTSSRARSDWPGCSTTSERSASRTASCASPVA